MPLPEKALIELIRRMAGAKRPRRMGGASAAPGEGSHRPPVAVGIGDDCAVLQTGAAQDTLITSDFSLEGIHFRRDWHPPESVGHRCLARGLSDIAAMGGKPLAAFLSLALPRDLPQAWVERFLRGLIALADRHGAPLAGGDTAQSPSAVLADIIVAGTVPRGKAILRSGARAGDRIFVSGALGGSAAAIHDLENNARKKIRPSDYPQHFYPEPRVELGRLLREKGIAASMVDTSDGLSTDLAHLCEESGVGARIDVAAIPRARVGKPERVVDLDLALHGGEDYELLFTSRPGKRIPARIAGLELTEIGEITRGRRIFYRDSQGVRRVLEPGGWEHFRRSS